jgi:hypothetical protein
MALKDGYLLFATHPDAIATFRKGAAVPPAGDTPIMHIALARLADSLQQRRDSLAQYMSEKRGTPAEAFNAALDSLAATLDIFDDLWLTQRMQDGQATWTVRLRQR